MRVNIVDQWGSGDPSRPSDVTQHTDRTSRCSGIITSDVPHLVTTWGSICATIFYFLIHWTKHFESLLDCVCVCLWAHKHMQVFVVKAVMDDLLQLLLAGILTMLLVCACVCVCFTALLGCSFMRTLPGCIYLPRLKQTQTPTTIQPPQPGLLCLPPSFLGSTSPVQGAINSLSPPLRS